MDIYFVYNICSYIFIYLCEKFFSESLNSSPFSRTMRSSTFHFYLVHALLSSQNVYSFTHVFPLTVYLLSPTRFLNNVQI